MADIYIHHRDLLVGDYIVHQHLVYRLVNIHPVPSHTEYRFMLPDQEFEHRDELLMLSSFGITDFKLRLFKSAERDLP